jgi:hypothetical protein
MSKLDELIDNIFMRGLPAKSYKDIAAKIGSNLGLVNFALNALRANPEKYGWTIPHVKRGRTGAKDEGRFYPVLIAPDGQHDFNYAENQEHLWAGLKSTVALVAAQSKNEAQAIRIAAEYVNEPVALRRMLKLAGSLDLVENQAQSLLDVLKAA